MDYSMLMEVFDTLDRNDTAIDPNNSLEKVLRYLNSHPVEAPSEAAAWDKLCEVMKELGLGSTEAGRIVALLKTRFATKTDVVSYFPCSDSVSSKVALGAKPYTHKRSKTERPKNVVSKKEEPEQRTREDELRTIEHVRQELEVRQKLARANIESKQDRPRSMLIEGDGWTYEVRIAPGGVHSGGSGKRTHLVAYQVGSSLIGSDQSPPSGPILIKRMRPKRIQMHKGRKKRRKQK